MNLGSRSWIKTPSGIFIDAQLATIAGQSVARQTVEACPPKNILTGSFTRPADTTADTANDAMSNSTSAPVAVTFASAGREKGLGGLIRRAILVKSTTAGTFSCELWLFYGNTAPGATNDNAAFTVAGGSLDDPTTTALLAIIRFDTSNGINVAKGIYQGTLWNSTTNFDLGIPYVTGALGNPTSKDLYGLVRVLTGYTPGNAEVFKFALLLEDQE